MREPSRLAPPATAIIIFAGVVSISLLHYLTSPFLVVLHEVFERLYYIPIVIAAVVYGWRAGLATSVLATALYVPHIETSWPRVEALRLDQYGDVLLFNLVGVVTGTLADRLRLERNRYRRAAADLQRANRELVARADERLRMDRLVTIGRLASGIAHEVRNPLGSILACFEILAPIVGGAPDKEEFLTIAREEALRLGNVVKEFLEFAYPAAPSRQSADLRDLVGGAIRLAEPTLAARGLDVDFVPSQQSERVHLDGEQLQRALVNLLLDPLAPGRSGRLCVSMRHGGAFARIRIDVPGVVEASRLAPELFDPFPQCGNGHGLSLAVARRLIENQGGSARVEAEGRTLRYLIDLPIERSTWQTQCAPC